MPNDEDDFKQPLFNKSDLAAGLHDVVLTDLSSKSDRPWLDLDYGIITLGDGDMSYVVVLPVLRRRRMLIGLVPQHKE